ncbi:MAG: acetyltransferase [Clostridiales bacterium]|nr:acetyltransferase [Clostridiales bacterium]
MFSVISALLIAAAAAPSTIISRLFSFRPLLFIGKISYGLYLWQFPVIVITNAMFESSSINVLLCLSQVAITFALATASYCLIEMPIRKMKILKAFKQKSFNGFCRFCLHTKWQNKTAALLMLSLLLTSCIGMLSARALPNSETGDLSSVSEQNLSVPPAEPEPTNDQPVSSPPFGQEVSPPPSADITTGSPPSPSTSPPNSSPPPPDSANQEIIPNDLFVTIIGDSVGIGVEPRLKEYYPNTVLYAEVGRQFYQARPIVKQLLQTHALSSTVVIELGSNGIIKESHMRELIELIGSDRKIVFVNTQVPRSWCEGVNSTLEKISADYDNAIIADWYSVSVDKAEYFYKDGVHTSKTGTAVLAEVIADAIAVIQPYKPYIPLN